MGQVEFSLGHVGPFEFNCRCRPILVAAACGDVATQRDAQYVQAGGSGGGSGKTLSVFLSTMLASPRSGDARALKRACTSGSRPVEFRHLSDAPDRSRSQAEPLIAEKVPGIVAVSLSNRQEKSTCRPILPSTSPFQTAANSGSRLRG
jgi:hypothetical protein